MRLRQLCCASRFLVLCILALLICLAEPAFGQLGGEQFRGDLGLKSGSQAPPGLYVAETLFFYRPTEVTGTNGAPLPGNVSLNIFAPALGLNYVSKKEDSRRALWCGVCHVDSEPKVGTAQFSRKYRDVWIWRYLLLTLSTRMEFQACRHDCFVRILRTDRAIHSRRHQ